MTEFTDLNLNKDPEDMTEGELRETLSDFMDAHRENRDAYDAKASEIEDVEDEYSERVDELEEKVAAFKQERADEAAEYVKMPADLLADRFSFSELEQIIEEGADAQEEFSEAEGSEDEDDEHLTTFADREEKGERGGDGKPKSKFSKSAADLLAEQGLPTGGD